MTELLNKGFIRESISTCAIIAFSAPKDGKWKMCMDNRAINKTTVKYRCTVLRLDGIPNIITGATIFSKINIKSNYHQIKVHPKMKGRPPSIQDMGFTNGWSCILVRKTHPARSWEWWYRCLDHLQGSFWLYTLIAYLSIARLNTKTSTT